MIARLIFKSIQDRDYIKNFSNRFGFYKEDPKEHPIWFHAVSLGEVIGSENIIKNKQAIYDLKVDKNVNKIGNGSKLEDYPLAKLPQYLKNNIEKYKNWLS